MKKKNKIISCSGMKSSCEIIVGLINIIKSLYIIVICLAPVRLTTKLTEGPLIPHNDFA